MTDRSTWIAEKKQTDRLMTPEGQAQDCLERSLPAAVLREAQADPLWNTQPETVTKVTLYASVLEQARARLARKVFADTRSVSIEQARASLARLRSWQKLFDTYVREQAGTPLLTWAGNTAHSLARGYSNPETNAGLFSVKAQEVFLGFIRDQQQCVFRIGDVNREESPVFSAAMRAVIGTLPESTPELWDLAIKRAVPKPLTPEERAGLRQSCRGERIMQDRADEAMAVLNFCQYMCGDLDTCSRSDELLGLCAVGHAFHTSRCTSRSLPAELQPGFRLFKSLIAMRKRLICLASAAQDWDFMAKGNPDLSADDLTAAVIKAHDSGEWPRSLNVDYDTWYDLLNGGEMANYPDIRPDTLYILSAQSGNLGLWRVLE